MSRSPLSFFARMNFSLRVFLTLAVILLGFAVASGLAFGIIQRQGLKDSLLHQGDLMAGMLAGSLAQGLFFEDRAKVEAATNTLLSMRPHADLRAVAAYDANDGIVLRRLVAGDEASHAESRLIGPMATALASFHRAANRKTVWEGDGLLIFTVPVTVAAERRSRESLYFDTEVTEQQQPRTVIGYAQLAIGKQQFDQELTRIASQTTVLTALFLGFALAATYALTRDTLRPLQRLMAVIREREGNREAKEEESITLLGDAFNRLLADLENAFATIQGLKDGLEATVAERTAELRHALDELKETHIQLAQSEKMVAIGRLVAGVAHEINNTTNFVSGALPPLRKRVSELEALLGKNEDTPPDPERCAALFKSVSTLLDNINEGARRTNKIVNDLKNFSRPADEETGPVDINQCLQATCSLAYPEYKYRIELQLDLADNLPPVEGAQGQLNQVFMNLLLNAVQAILDKGTILIRSRLKAGRIHVLFKDSGPGIAPEVIDRVFEPFFTTKEVGKGTGLGLSISYGIIKKHQGEILVRSEPGRGAEFEIMLPVMRREQLPEQWEVEG